jgi:hypothetical protein
MEEFNAHFFVYIMYFWNNFIAEEILSTACLQLPTAWIIIDTSRAMFIPL